MTKRETILTLILFIAISFLGFSLIEENHAREISVLQNRIILLEQIIMNYEEQKTLNDELELIEVAQMEVDSLDREWFEWIGENMWICDVEWGE